MERQKTIFKILESYSISEIQITYDTYMNIQRDGVFQETGCEPNDIPIEMYLHDNNKPLTIWMPNRYNSYTEEEKKNFFIESVAINIINLLNKIHIQESIDLNDMKTLGIYVVEDTALESNKPQQLSDEEQYNFQQMIQSYTNLYAGLDSTEKLLDWTTTNIQYDEIQEDWKLRSPSETFRERKGNCHDQSLFLLNYYKNKRMGYGQLFFIECSEDSKVGGNTHTLTYIRVGPQYQWLETSWIGNQGIRVFDSIEEMKSKILELMKPNENSDSIKFEGIRFSVTPGYGIGMSLGEYVESWDLEEKLYKYSDVNTVEETQ